MSKSKQEAAKLPEPLHQTRKHFDQWRRTHEPHSRFSEGLWSEAVSAARDYVLASSDPDSKDSLTIGGYGVIALRVGNPQPGKAIPVN